MATPVTTPSTDGTSAAKHVRIALLICDTPVPAVVATRGDYLAIYNAHLRATLPPHAHATLTVDGYEVRENKYPADDAEYDAYVLTGSASSAYDDIAWISELVEFVRTTAETKPHIKIIGICFGHQIIARALGGKCVPNDGRWEVGTHDMELTDLGKKVFKQESICIQQMHRDHVPTLPPSCFLLGSSPVSPIQGFILPSLTCPPSDPTADIQIFTVQGHPEFTGDIVNHIIDVRAKTGAMDPATVQDGRARAVRKDDGIGPIGNAIWRVLGIPS